MPENQASLGWVVGALAVVVALFGWGFLAGSYVGAHATPMSEMSPEELKELNTRTPLRAKRASMSTFVSNAVEQLPNMGGVISWHFTNRIWLPILILAAELGVLGGGIIMKRVESSLAQPTRRRHR